MMLRSFGRFASELISALRGLIWRFGGRTIHRLRVLPGKTFQFHHYGDITRILYEQQHLIGRKKSFEADTLQTYLDLIRPGSVVLDIGANVGLYSLLGSVAAGPGGRILAFEPEGFTHTVLLKNLALNGAGNVTAFQMALSDTNGKVRLSVPTVVKAHYSYGDSYLSMTPATTKDQGASIECRRLDEVLAEIGIDRVDLVKIDIEGAEYLCLSGASALINGDRKPVILLECDELLSRRFGYSVFDTLLLLHRAGYASEQIGVHQWIARPIG